MSTRKTAPAHVIKPRNDGPVGVVIVPDNETQPPARSKLAASS